MSRLRRALLTSGSSVLCQVVTLICGFILPRLLLEFFGSAVNGLVSSISQFLGFITLAECGVGVVVRSAFYKPLAQKNDYELSKIVISSDNFFRKIALLLIAYTVLLMGIYPLITKEAFEYIYTATLIAIISISSFAQYFLGMTYRLLVFADQKGYIYYFLHSITLILNTLLCVVLMKMGASIHMVKLGSSIVFVLQPLFLNLYAKKHYRIDRSIKLTEEPIKQKWNGLAQHVAGVVLFNTDVAVLTLFSSLENVSVYSVFYLVVNGIRLVVDGLAGGPQALFGDMYAKNEIEPLKNTFNNFEWLIHTLVTYLYTLTAILITPFVMIYTKNINDANYNVPVFAIMLVVAQATYCVRLPYNMLVQAAGRFRETQNSAIIEALINILVSVVLVWRYGLIGVAIGTFVSMVYRTVYFAIYISKDIIKREFSRFLYRVLVDLLSVIIIIIIATFIPDIFCVEDLTYSSWIMTAIKASITCLIVFILVNTIMCNSEMKGLASKIMRRRKS